MSKHYPSGVVTESKPTHVDSSYQEGSHYWYSDLVLPSRTVTQLSPSTPGFRRLKSSGARIPMQNYHKESYLWKHCNGSRLCTRTQVGPPSVTQVTVNRNGLMYTAGCPNEYTARYLFYMKFMYDFVPKQSDLVNSALSNVPHGPDILTFLAEIKELGELHKAVVTAIKKCGKGRFSAPWLLWRYGISPLMSDIHELSESAAAITMNLHNKSGTYTSGKSSTVTFSDDLENMNFSITTGDPQVKKIAHSQHAKCSGSVYYQVNGIAQSSMFMTIDPFLTAWELVPLSFVLDWLIDIGGAIDAANVSSKIHQPQVALNYMFEFNSGASATGLEPPDPVYVWRGVETRDGIDATPYLLESYGASHREEYGFQAIFKGRNVSSPSQVFPELPRFRPEINLFRQVDAMSLYSVFTDKELAGTSRNFR